MSQDREVIWDCYNNSLVAGPRTQSEDLRCRVIWMKEVTVYDRLENMIVDWRSGEVNPGIIIGRPVLNSVCMHSQVEFF